MARKTIIVPFHQGDQRSAQLLLENILSCDSGCDNDIEFYLQFDGPEDSCQILDSIDRLRDRFAVTVGNELLEIAVPPAFLKDDPNAVPAGGIHTIRDPITKKRIFAWNRAVYSAIQEFDYFVIIEPDCLILKDGWARDIIEASLGALQTFPIFGHLKRGRIGGKMVPTHYAGCSVYNGAELRKIIGLDVFQNRYPNPWWPLRSAHPTEAAGNCFWGPMFSGYDISFDYFLYAHLQIARNGHDRPLDWKVDDLETAEHLLRCEFRSTRSVREIIRDDYNVLPVLHGVKTDDARHSIIKLQRGAQACNTVLSGPAVVESVDFTNPCDKPKRATTALNEIDKKNSRLVTMRDLKDAFRGQRCTIIANGPSLKKTDLRRLAGEYTIGLNRISLNVDNMGFEPTFLCCVNKNVIEQFSDEIDRMSSIKFIAEHGQDYLKNTWNTFFMGSLPKVGYFEKDLSQQMWCEGWTVTYCAMQVAYYLGFETVVLVGLDHYFGDSGAPNKAVVSAGADVNHFHPDYFGKGVIWQYPDIARSEQHYRVAKEVFEADGRRLCDATIGGHCQIFEKAEFESVFSSSKAAHGTIGKPKVSIIMPFFNEEKFIGTAIRSIQEQDFSDFEIICVDDGSTDASSELVKSAAQRDARIRLLPNDGKGVSAARNTALSIARGDYITFLDADDTMVVGALAARVDALDRNPDWRIVHGRTSFIDEDGLKLGPEIGLPRTITFDDCSGVPAPFNALMYRADAFRFVRFPVGLTNGEDWLTIAKLLRSGGKSHYIDRICATYRVHPKSTVLMDMEKHEAALKSVIAWLFSESDDKNVDERYRLGLDPKRREGLERDRLVGMLFWKILNGDAEAARNIASTIETEGWWKEINWASRKAQLELASVRSLGLPVNQLSALPQAKNSAIFGAISRVASHLPADDLRRLFIEIFGEANSLKSYERIHHVNVDETAVVAHLLRDKRGLGNIMIDVGAHVGTSAAEFAKLGWRIVCFEPDPQNRAQLWSRFAGSTQVTIDPRAVAERAESSRSFYASEESTGISGMLKFRETHREVAKVDVTTVADALQTYGLGRMDFLKIDVEGYDFAVLKGVPWEVTRPGVIECEFEDSKTTLLGHTTEDIADFLVAKGYAVYVSEWHPIIRYGTRHDWRRVFKYPNARIGPDAWGNILAFIEDPGDEAVAAAFEQCLKRSPKIPTAQAVPISQPVPKTERPVLTSKAAAMTANATPKIARKSAVNGQTMKRAQVSRMSLYTRFAIGVERRVPELLPLGRRVMRNVRGVRNSARGRYTSMATLIERRSPFTVRAVRAVKRHTWNLLRHPVVLLGSLVVAVFIIAAMMHEPMRVFFLSAAGIVALSMMLNAVVAYYTFEVLERSQKLAREVDSAMSEFRNFDSEFGNAKSQIIDLTSGLKTAFNKITAQSIAHAGSVAQSEVQLSRKLQETEAHFTKVVGLLDEQFSYLTTEMEAQFSRLVEQTEAQFSSRAAEMEAQFLRLADQTGSQISNLATQTENQISAVGEKHATLMTAIARTPVLNGVRYQTFNRRITPELSRTLLEWSEKLGAGLNDQGIAYLASRIGWLELRMHGRLATSIEDVLLRSIVVRAAAGEPREVLEIGTLFGIGAAALQEAVAFDARGIKLTLLDPLDGYYDKSKDIRTQMPVNQDILQANLRIAGMDPDEITIVQKFSTNPDAIAAVGKKRYDVVIIDGDHSYEGAKFDFENYALFVKAGGYVIVDDFNSPDWPSVTKYVNDELVDRSALEFVGAQFRTAIFRVIDPAGLRGSPLRKA